MADEIVWSFLLDGWSIFCCRLYCMIPKRRVTVSSCSLHPCSCGNGSSRWNTTATGPWPSPSLTCRCRIPGSTDPCRAEILCSQSSLLEAGLTHFQHGWVEVLAALEYTPRNPGQFSGQDVEYRRAGVAAL